MRKNAAAKILITGFAIACAMIIGGKTKALAYNVGDEFTCDNVVYKVTKEATDSSLGKCMVVGASSNAKKIVIEAQPTKSDENVKLKCTSIKEGAFEDHENITYVKINESSSITAIPDNCFRDCDSLEKVIISNGKVKTIGKNAFNGCEDLSVFAINTKGLKKSAFKKKCFKDVESVTVYGPTKKLAAKYAGFAAKRGAANTSYAKYKASF